MNFTFKAILLDNDISLYSNSTLIQSYVLDTNKITIITFNYNPTFNTVSNKLTPIYPVYNNFSLNEFSFGVTNPKFYIKDFVLVIIPDITQVPKLNNFKYTVLSSISSGAYIGLFDNKLVKIQEYTNTISDIILYCSTNNSLKINLTSYNALFKTTNDSTTINTAISTLFTDIDVIIDELNTIVSGITHTKDNSNIEQDAVDIDYDYNQNLLDSLNEITNFNLLNITIPENSVPKIKTFITEYTTIKNNCLAFFI